MADLDVTRSETLTLTDTGAGRLSPLLQSVTDPLYVHDAGYLTKYDSGALADGIYDVLMTLGDSAAAKWVLIHRNAANTGDVGERIWIYTPATGSRHVRLRVKVAQSERLQVWGPYAPVVTVRQEWI